MIVFLFSFKLNAAHPFKYTFNSTSKTATVTGLNVTDTILVNVNIPSNIIYNNVSYTVTSIAEKAFQNCENISGTLTLPKSLKSIQGYAFSGCKNLSGELLLPEGLEVLGTNVFARCTGFVGKLKLPSSLTDPGYSWTFSGCSGLTSVEIPDDIKITKFAYGMFNECEGLIGELIIPGVIKNMGVSSFRNTGFSTIILKEGVEEVNATTFYNCPNLKKIIFPKTLTKIAYQALDECPQLDTVICWSTTPPSHYIGPVNTGAGVESVECCIFSDKNIKNNLRGFPYDTVKLYVPEESLGIYKKTFEWKSFENIYGIIEYPQQIKIIPSELTLSVDEKYTLDIEYTPSNCFYKDIIWDSANIEIVDVDSSSNIVAKGVGETEITATSPNGVKDSIKIIVHPIFASNVTINVPDHELFAGSKYVLTALVEPSNTTNKNVTWSSADESIATIHKESGELSALTAGEVEIRAACGDISTSAKILVKENLYSDLEELTGHDNIKVSIYSIQGNEINGNASKEDILHLKNGCYIIKHGFKADKILIK